VTLLTEQILYVESNDAETWVHTLDGERYRNKTNISQWEQILEDDFLRTHRSFLVNINQVTKMETDSIQLGETSIPVSRKYKEVVVAKVATTT
jgi:DNA-binding LytR/AlgR family response regulator